MADKTVYQTFECLACGGNQRLRYEEQARPRCCGEPMRAGRISWPSDEIGELRLHMIKLRERPRVTFPSGVEPAEIIELWRLAPGRRDGEKIGYIGLHATGVEWTMARGFGEHAGTAVTAANAAQQMLIAAQGGANIAYHIGEIRNADVVS